MVVAAISNSYKRVRDSLNKAAVTKITMMVINKTNRKDSNATLDAVVVVVPEVVVPEAADALETTIPATSPDNGALMEVWAAMVATIRTLTLIKGAAMVKVVNQCAVVVHKDVSSVVISIIAAVADHVDLLVMTVS